MSFDEEVSRAVTWLSETCLPADSAHRNDFERCVQAAMVERYTGHWYPTEPHRGCAFRAITCNGAWDPLIRRASREANIQLGPPTQSVFMLWINPGEVKVLLDSGVRKTVFHAGQKSNPYCKPRVRIERTRVNVTVDSTASAPTSSDSLASSSNGSSPTLSPFAAEFAPASSASEASESDSEQDGHPTPNPVRATPPPGLLVPGMMPVMVPPQSSQYSQAQRGGSWYPYARQHTPVEAF